MKSVWARGFTLIELMVALAIAVILLVLAAPAYVSWLADSEILNSAQSVAGGLRQAQAEAIKRNDKIEFVLDKTTGSGGWVVRDLGGTTLSDGKFAAGSARVGFTPAPAGTTTVTFNGLGGVETANADASAPMTSVGVATTSSASSTHPLTILVGGGRTGIKICNAAYTWPDPKACPP